MLRKACVADLRGGRVSLSDGYLAVCMCRYPRGLPKSSISAYHRELAPEPELLDAFHAERERLGGNHNAAFLSTGYQRRFALSAAAVESLRALAERARDQDVFLICQCALDERCHRELLLIAAKRWFGSRTELRTFSYPDFEARLPADPKAIGPE